MLDLIFALIPLDVPPLDAFTPSSEVNPPQSSGIAVYLFGGVFALGLIILITVLLSAKPKRRPPIQRP